MYNERRNPDYADAARADNTADLPLFDALPVPAVQPAEAKFTSREAWYEIRASGRIDLRQQQVLECLEANEPCTTQEIAELLHWPINCVTPRILELRDDLLLIEIAATKENPNGTKLNGVTNRNNKLYRIRPQ